MVGSGGVRTTSESSDSERTSEGTRAYVGEMVRDSVLEGERGWINLMARSSVPRTREVGNNFLEGLPRPNPTGGADDGGRKCRRILARDDRARRRCWEAPLREYGRTPRTSGS